MSHGSGKKKHKKHEEEEHENHERWLVTYADMLTLLMVLFIVLFAMSTVDTKKFKALQAGLAAGFGGQVTPMSGSSKPIGESDSIQMKPSNALVAIAPNVQQSGQVTAALDAKATEDKLKAKQAAHDEAEKLREIQKQMEKALADKNMSGAAKFTIDERGLIVTIVTDKVLFAADRAELQPGGKTVLDAIGPVLKKTPNMLLVGGHTNTVDVKPKYFPSEWELSATRASSVVRWLISHDGIAAKRLTAVGYADQRPLYGPDNPRANVLNRRVEVVVQTSLPPDSATLLKGEAKVVAAEEAKGTEEHATEATAAREPAAEEATPAAGDESSGH